MSQDEQNAQLDLLTGDSSNSGNPATSGRGIGGLFRRKNSATSSSDNNVDDGASTGKESLFRDSGSVGEETQPSLGAASQTDEGVSSSSESDGEGDRTEANAQEQASSKEKKRRRKARDLLDDGADFPCEEEEGEDEEGDGDNYNNNEEEEEEEEDDDREESDEDDKQEKETEEYELEYQRELVKRQQQTSEWKANFEAGYDEPDELAEMTSLIGSGGGSNQRNNPQRGKGRLGSSLSRLFGRKKNNNSLAAETPEEKERRALLDGEEEEDNEDYNYSNGACRDQMSGKEDFERKQSYHDNDHSEEGSMKGPQGGKFSEDYHNYGTTNGPDFLEGSQQDLYQRIQGFGNSDSALGTRYSDSPVADGRHLAQHMNHNSMTSMNIDYESEKRGFIGTVGNAVRGMRQKIKQRQQESDDEKSRMVAYIDELEFKLRQKETEVQQWKDRAEEMEKQIAMMREECADEICEDTDDDSVPADEEAGVDKQPPGAQEGDLLALTTDQTPVGSAPSEETAPAGTKDGEEASEGFLIDVTEKPPVFDPLATGTGSNPTPAEQIAEEDNLLDVTKYKLPEPALPLIISDTADEGKQELKKVKDEVLSHLEESLATKAAAMKTLKNREEPIDVQLKKLSQMPTIVG